MAITLDDFYSLLPEFADQKKYPPPQILILLKVGTKFVNESRWTDAYPLGVCLFAAHELALSRQATVASAAGAVPGTTTGVVASKSVGPVSKSYDTGISKYDDAGYWNLTSYGQRYWYFINLFGVGGSQIGMGFGG